MGVLFSKMGAVNPGGGGGEQRIHHWKKKETLNVDFRKTHFFFHGLPMWERLKIWCSYISVLRWTFLHRYNVYVL
jgi:hypothetical protein